MQIAGGMVIDDKWCVIDKLGEGGQARAWLVTQRGAGDAKHVLKQLKGSTEEPWYSTAISRFRREAAILKALRHPNIVRLIDFNLEHKPPFFVMEYCDGGGIQAIRDVNDVEEVIGRLHQFREVCAALGMLHDRNDKLTHRDLHPGNILLRGSAKAAVVTDFGLCINEGGSRHTLCDAVGRNGYRAPECDIGGDQEPTPAADVYSLGKVLYFLFRGSDIPFAREDFREPRNDLVVLHRSPMMEHVNRFLERVVKKSKLERPQSATALIPLVDELIRVFRHEANPVSTRTTKNQRCAYCHRGTYQLMVAGQSALLTLGIRSAGLAANLRIMSCDHCGNVQMFRTDSNAASDWLRKGSNEGM